ncbi:MAG TPA: GGDEF domain-containing protein [Candidatus Hydrogenedentes bacterium]|nr:GGDEF domain-containing protein [Candidatus Hydrogenedentota bacterium]HPG68658.1 GGDEF domain-containing protein [Candidatus Hydrogenedentota bacterium]
MTVWGGEATPSDTESVKSRRASLIIITGGEIGREIELTDKPEIFGRSVTATVRIPTGSVSREHARIELVEGNGEKRYQISDLGSRNGTRVNNVPVQQAWLNHGDKIHMGEVAFKFLLQDELDAAFHQRVHRLIHYDQLTGLLTLEAFWRQLDAAMHQGRKTKFTIAMTDLDGLKRVNDTHGHLAGRMVVREMGAMMRATIRPQDCAGLYGGDEAIILFAEASIDVARGVAEQLRRTVAERVFELEAQTFQVTISQGLAEWPTHGRKTEEIVAAADAALYQAKAGGRNCIRAAGE